MVRYSNMHTYLYQNIAAATRPTRPTRQQVPTTTRKKKKIINIKDHFLRSKYDWEKFEMYYQT